LILIAASGGELNPIMIKNMLANEQEIQRIIVFGSFINSKNPNDIDIAVFQNSKERYLELSMKYRKLVRELITIIPYDIIPIQTNASGSFLSDIEAGEIIYEKRN
jgi:predicted nucleotidyltransferase